MTATEIDIDAIEAAATTVQHHHVGLAKCSCGWDAYEMRGIMIDYADEIDNHVYGRREQKPRGVDAATALALVAEVRRLRADAQVGEAFRVLVAEGARVIGATS